MLAYEDTGVTSGCPGPRLCFWRSAHGYSRQQPWTGLASPVRGRAGHDRRAAGDRALMARMASRPNQVRVRYRGIPYTFDLVTCRRALVKRQVEGELDSMESLANAVGITHSPATRFFPPRPPSLPPTLTLPPHLPP